MAGFIFGWAPPQPRPGVRLARFGPENRRALETTSLVRIRSDYPGLLYPDDQLSLNGDGSFTPVGEKRSIVADYLGD